MKTEDVLLYGGIGLAAYLLFFKPKAAAAPATFVPTGQPQTYLPPAPVATNPLASSLSNIATTISNLINPPVTPTLQSTPTPSNTSMFDQQITDTVLATPALPTVYTAPLPPVYTAPIVYNAPAPAPYTPYKAPAPVTTMPVNTTWYPDITNQYNLKSSLISGCDAARIGLY